ncbi:MAG: LTA synthase family protein [Desulfuromonas sp.]|nr:LTA synthase family protein [Desulfuromonas sp.]
MPYLSRRPTATYKQMKFLGSSAALLLALFSILRLALLLYNFDQAATSSWMDIVEAFGNGLRFDLQLSAYIFSPLVLTLLLPNPAAHRKLQLLWLWLASSATVLVGLIEMVFYREFHQRLNGLVFQYMQQDPKTVLSMIWYGFPVLTFLSVWVGVSVIVALGYRNFHRRTRTEAHTQRTLAWWKRTGIFILCAAVIVLSARGTLRQGAPLRWGDAFTTNSTFTNQLGLNGTRSLFKAANKHFSRETGKLWKKPMPEEQARASVREVLVTQHEILIDENIAPVRRIYTPPPEGVLEVKNVVVILLESFAARYVGAMGDENNITPYFDQLTKEGLLFTRFFANGTHTHQGLFATMTSFPNLPGYEYLMQIPEGAHDFSGLTNLLSAKKFANLYVYNGDFAWDNQFGFFANQGMKNFIGRDDFIDPVVKDPTWGVSDQDVFDRAVEEFAHLQKGEPFFALLQTLSNHTPYPLPNPLPTEEVKGVGAVDKHLSAMRYSDWALGQFFDAIRTMPFYNQTLFVLVGDHGFGNDERVTEMDLNRFQVPLLLLAPGIQEIFGEQCNRVGSQVDIVPTIMGRLGEQVQHQCWGRDLLALPAADPGFAIIKPSGSDQSVAIIQDNNILVWPEERKPTLEEYDMHRHSAQEVENPTLSEKLGEILQAYIETATLSLQQNTTGAQTPTPSVERK